MVEIGFALFFPAHAIVMQCVVYIPLHIQNQFVSFFPASEKSYATLSSPFNSEVSGLSYLGSTVKSPVLSNKIYAI